MSFTYYAYYLCVILLLVSSLFVRKDYRWILLLAFSIFFYGYSRWWYVLLLFASISIDYICALKIEASLKHTQRRLFLTLSIISNLSILIFFKYFTPIYAEWNWIEIRSESQLSYLEGIVLPLGISFYTLQSMGYTIDVYRKHIAAERHFGIFSLYVSFFPQLVAGPIERPDKLLPQLKSSGNINLQNIQSGFLLILVGLGKKLIISDRLFALLNNTQQNEIMFGWQALSFGTIALFAIYMDLSAYTDIARGSARLFGIDLSLNFKKPMAARSLGEYWKRWHISLSSWIQNYVFRSLCLVSDSPVYRYFALILTFTIIGIWHGPTIPFLVLGIMHGIIIALEKLNARKGYVWPKTRLFNALRHIRMHIIYNISGTLFLSPTLADAANVFQQILSFQSFWNDSFLISGENPLVFSFYISIGLVLMFSGEFINKHYKFASENIGIIAGHFVLMFFCLCLILLCSFGGSNEFFYFDF